MKELFEGKSNIEQFESDQERLKFLKDTIQEAIKAAYAEQKNLSTRNKEFWELCDDPNKHVDFITVEMLNNLRQKLDNDSRLKEYASEINALIEGSRIMFIQNWLRKYKEYQLMEKAPQLSREEIQEQDKMREDITEGRALLQWHILQNEQNPEYLKDFLRTLNNLWGWEGFEKEKGPFFRGLIQELGVYKLLKKHFPSVTTATPKEDAHYSIDFWVGTKSGKTLMIQSKSSGMFGKGGIFNKKQIEKLKGKMEQQNDATTDYYVDFEGQEYIPPLVRAKRLERSIEEAKEYSEEKGIQEAQYFLVISNSGNFEHLTGEPKPKFTKKLEKQLELLASN